MPKAISIDKFGAPEVMLVRDAPHSIPGQGEARVTHRAVGLNYLDVIHRRGEYPLSLPTGLGVSGCGVIQELGSLEPEFAVGDLVAYAGVPPGSYAEERSVPVDRLVRVPNDMDPVIVAASLQQGITAAFLLLDVFEVARHHIVLIHAAAGGVGTIACQWAKMIGATVIGSVGSPAKIPHALSHGCDYVIVAGEENIEARVKAITSGRGVDVVYDSIGAQTFMSSLKSLAFRGLCVSFGSASGEPPPLDVGSLAQLGSLYLTRPRFVQYTRSRTDLTRYADAFFDRIRMGLEIPISRTYSLIDIVAAHHDLEGRRTIGSSAIRFE